MGQRKLDRGKLQAWAASLTEEKAKEVLVELIAEVDGMEIVVVPDTGVPYWDCNGESLDGSDRE